MHASHIQPGGVAQDMPLGSSADVSLSTQTNLLLILMQLKKC